MADRSPLQQVADNVFERLKTMRELPSENIIPFGLERVDKKVAFTKMKKLTPEGRKKLINKVGLENVLDIIEGANA